MKTRTFLKWIISLLTFRPSSEKPKSLKLLATKAATTIPQRLVEALSDKNVDAKIHPGNYSYAASIPGCKSQTIAPKQDSDVESFLDSEIQKYVKEMCNRIEQDQYMLAAFPPYCIYTFSILQTVWDGQCFITTYIAGLDIGSRLTWEGQKKRDDSIMEEHVRQLDSVPDNITDNFPEISGQTERI